MTREESRGFCAEGHNYEIKMCFEGPKGPWYEIWRNQTLVGERNPWPISEVTGKALSSEELVRRKEEQYNRSGETRKGA